MQVIQIFGVSPEDSHKKDLGTVAEVKNMFELCHLQKMLEYKVDADAEEGRCGP